MIITYEGREMTVHLLPGCITVELRGDMSYQGEIIINPQPIYIIEYDEINRIIMKSNIVILYLNDGTKISLEINNPQALYENLLKILISIGKH